MPMSTREQLADYAHDAWSGWMKYLFQRGELRQDGSFVIYREDVERWRRQLSTPYAELSREEQQSDLAEADRMLAILETKAD